VPAWLAGFIPEAALGINPARYLQLPMLSTLLKR